MSNILLVTSSPRGEASLSSRVARTLADQLKGDTDATIVHRDLNEAPLPHIGEAFAVGSRKPADDRTPAEASAIAISDELVDELLAADTVVIATGMINFGVSSQLKTWIDNVLRAGRTFTYTEAGPKGLASGRRAYVVVASGGVYSEGPAAAFNHADTYLRTVLGFIGITDPDVIHVEGVALAPDAAEKAVERALGKATELLAAA